MQARLRDGGSPRRVRACAGMLLGAAALAASTLTVAAAPPNALFNSPLPLPGGAGATASGISVVPDGSLYVAGSTSAATGCVLFSVSHGGAHARFLGRTPGGLACSIATVGAGGSDGLGLATSGSEGLLSGSAATPTGGFQWKKAAAGTAALPALAADPAPPAGRPAALFLIVRTPDGLPHIAASTDGGTTYTTGSALIDRADVPAGQWQGPGPLPVVGNLVARRDATGLRLFAVFATAEGAHDRARQVAAKTNNLNRIYEALGVVTPALTFGGAPSVVWHDVEVFHGAPGTALNRGLPGIALDSAGHVATTFADGRHVYVKEDFDGLQWDAGAKPAAIDAVAPGLPAGLDASLAPAIAGAGNGKLDVAWYGATGGDAASRDPAADPVNSWAVYMAQTLDGGRSWTASPVSGAQPVHQGPADPAGAVQLAIDQATGAAAVAYTGDPVVPGLPSLYATRQCTGRSAVSGQPLLNDCVASQPTTPVLPGTSCPGPQVNDTPADAIDLLSGGGSRAGFDLLQVRFSTANDAAQRVTLTVNRLSTSLPSDIAQGWWVVTWTQGVTQRYAQATIVQGQQPAYSVGTVNHDGSLSPGTDVPGMVKPGAGGSFLITLPLQAIGSPAAGVALTDISAASYVRYVSGPLASPMLLDRAPDAGTGADYAVAQTCSPAVDLPEVPAAVLVPVVGGIVGFFIYVRRRRRPRRAEQ